jgi:hypothetical protein
LRAVIERAVYDFFTEIPGLVLGMQQFDGDVAEGSVGVVAGDMGEAAAGEVDFTVLENEMGFWLAKDGVGDVGGAEGDENVVVVMLMELSFAKRRDFDEISSHVGVFNLQVMMRFAGNIAARQRHRDGRLGAEGKEEESRQKIDGFHGGVS